MTDTHAQVQYYYGKELQSSADLKTSACCCSADSTPNYVREVLPLIAPEIVDKTYGCGSPIPPNIEGLTVLDLGCGTGRDVYILSKLVGEHGRVIGVDMTPEQLNIAKKYQDYHAQAFGYAQSNVELILGYIEDLSAVESASVDLVISNCVINLSPHKDKVFAEIYRVLGDSGQLYFSDVFADQRLSAEVQSDPVLVGECLGGAMYTDDFLELMAKTGFKDVQIVNSSVLAIDEPTIAAKLQGTTFYSNTVQASKTMLSKSNECCNLTTNCC